jgi:hypothetical protein
LRVLVRAMSVVASLLVLSLTRTNGEMRVSMQPFPRRFRSLLVARSSNVLRVIASHGDRNDLA